MYTSIKTKHGEFMISLSNSSNPGWMSDSFIAEQDIRDAWWDVQPGEVVYDVGAGYGSYTLPALLAGAQVVAFEPEKNRFFDLCLSVYMNGFSKEFLPINMMAGDAIGFAIFYPESSSALRSETGRHEWRHTIPIDKAVPHIERVDRIKIDVEGYEVKAVRGALETIKKFRPQLLIEYHLTFVPMVLEDIDAMLTPLGYEEQKISDPKNNWGLWSPK